MKNIVILMILSCSIAYGQKIEKFNSVSDPYQKIPSMKINNYKPVQDRAGQDPDLTIGISLSGGGSRAQFFSLGVLMGLEEIKYKESTVLNETDYFSTVSGGGFAAGLYYRFLIDKKPASTFNKFFNDLEKLPVINISTKKRRLLFNSGGKYVKYVTKINKAIFDKGKNGYDSSYFHDLMPLKGDAGRVKYPYIIPNAAVYSNGDLFQFVPDVLKELEIDSSDTGGGGKRRGGYHTFKSGYPLAFGIAVSSAFPKMLPHQNLYNRKGETITVFDGGLYDNLGVSSLSSALIQENVSRRKLAIIVNSSGRGTNSPFANPRDLKLFKFFGRALLYPVDMNILRNKNNLKTLFNGDPYIYMELSEFPKTNRIDILDPGIVRITSNKRTYKSKELYKLLVKSLKEKSLVSDDRIFSIPWNKFSEISDYEKFLIFEIASNTETKLKIREHELNTLILAGRMMVSNEQKSIEKKLKE